VFAAGVVEVLARGEDFHGLRARTAGNLKQAGVQTMVQKQMRGQDAQHDREFSRSGTSFPIRPDAVLILSSGMKFWGRWDAGSAMSRA
jgi:hypothetical protein